NEREEARMIDVKIVWENVFFEAREKLAHVRRAFGRAVGKACNQIAGRPLRTDRFTAPVGEMPNENIDNAIPELAHLLFGTFQLRRMPILAHPSVVAGIGDPGKR